MKSIKVFRLSDSRFGYETFCFLPQRFNQQGFLALIVNKRCTAFDGATAFAPREIFAWGTNNRCNASIIPAPAVWRNRVVNLLCTTA
jgi:hypothetical protein